MPVTEIRAKELIAACLMPVLVCWLFLGSLDGVSVGAEATDTGFESDQARLVRKTAKGQEWLEMGQEVYDLGDKAASVTKTLQRIQDTDKRISELRAAGAELDIAQQREMQKLMTSLKDDVRSLGSGSSTVSALVDTLKGKLAVISERLRDIKVPPKADFSFLKQTVFETTSSNPKEACAVVTRLTTGRQEIAGTVAQLDKTIEGLNGVQSRLTHAEELTQKLWSLLSVPVVNIPIYYSAPDIYDLQESIGPVIGEVQDKRRDLERARDYDKKELSARAPEIDQTIALYRAKHNTDPCQAVPKEPKKEALAPGASKKNSPPITYRTVPTLSDPCLSYTITSQSKSIVNVRIENTCERESVKVEHACTSIGLKPICKTCDEAVALWKTTNSKTCVPGP